MAKKILAFVLALMTLVSGFAGAVSAETAGPDIECKAYILCNDTKDVVISSKNADQRLYPASITKVMTAILAIENADRNAKIKVTSAAQEGLFDRGSKLYLAVGEEIEFKDALAYLLLPSSNDMANALAISVAGGIPQFVAMMNKKAKELGMTNTSFANPHGLHEESHYTTARDILTMCRYAMGLPEFAEMVKNPSYTVSATNKSAEKTLISTNFLISASTTDKYLYSACIGIKTGTTTPAGLCFASAADIDGSVYFGVVLGVDPENKNGQFAAMLDLFRFAPTAYGDQLMVDHTQPVTEVKVQLGKDQDSVTAVPVEDYYVYLPNDFDINDVTCEISVCESVNAPVKKGDVLGKAEYTYEDVSVTIDLVADSDVEQSVTLVVMNSITEFFSSSAFKIIVGVLLILIVVFVVWIILLNRKKARGKYGRYKAKYRR